MGQDLEHDLIHCSPLLIRPKEVDKRRIILDLSYPHGLSLITLKFPSIDYIVNVICSHVDNVTIPKTDLARAF